MTAERLHIMLVYMLQRNTSYGVVVECSSKNLELLPAHTLYT